MTLVPKHIKELSPYKAGKPISKVQRELGLDRIVKLASNENPLGPPQSSIDAAEISISSWITTPPKTDANVPTVNSALFRFFMIFILQVKLYYNTFSYSCKLKFQISFDSRDHQRIMYCESTGLCQKVHF